MNHGRAWWAIVGDFYMSVSLNGKEIDILKGLYCLYAHRRLKINAVHDECSRLWAVVSNLYDQM